MSASEGSDLSDSSSSGNEGGHPLDNYLNERTARDAKPSKPAADSLDMPRNTARPAAANVSHPSPSSSNDESLEDRDEEDIDAALAAAGQDSPILLETSSEDEQNGSENDSESDSGTATSSDSEDQGPASLEEPHTIKKIPNPKVFLALEGRPDYFPEEMPPPVGVTVLAPGTEGKLKNAEMVRLLRQPRYFDDDYEEAGIRCFKCGGAGHMARDCTNAATYRPCYMCAQFGHDGRDCPNALCWKCNKPGHQSRDCPNTGRWADPWDKKTSARSACLRCGREDCPCAGLGDYARAEGGCTTSYRKKDLAVVRCYSCGKLGHTGCVQPSLGPPKLSCHNCGEGGHTAEECWKERPHAVRAERRRDPQGVRHSSGGRSGGGGGGGGYSAGGGVSGGGYNEGYSGGGGRYSSGRDNGGYSGGGGGGYKTPSRYNEGSWGGGGGGGGRRDIREPPSRGSGWHRGSSGGGGGGGRYGETFNSFSVLDDDHRSTPGFKERLGKRKQGSRSEYKGGYNQSNRDARSGGGKGGGGGSNARNSGRDRWEDRDSKKRRR